MNINRDLSTESDYGKDPVEEPLLLITMPVENMQSAESAGFSKEEFPQIAKKILNCLNVKGYGDLLRDCNNFNEDLLYENATLGPFRLQKVKKNWIIQFTVEFSWTGVRDIWHTWDVDVSSGVITKKDIQCSD